MMLGDDVDGGAIPLVQAVVQRSVGGDVLDEQHGERADQFGRPVEPLGHPAELGDQVSGSVVRVGVVVGVAGVEHRVEQLLLGLEVMQQPGGGHPGLLGDLGQRGVAPAVARQQPLGHAEDPLPAVLALGEERRVGPRGARGCHGTPSFNQPSEHTVGRFVRCDKGLSEKSFDGAITPQVSGFVRPIAPRGRATWR